MRKWWPLVAICLGTFMLLVDVTIVNVALPEISRALRPSMAALQWVVDAYALALAALLLTAGACADFFGRRRMYLVGLAVFAGASLLCGLAPGPAVLIAGRAVQGVGGAVMFATTTALLASVYAGRDRAVAFSVWGAVSGSATAAGPVLGGLLSQHWGWPAVFLVNLPVAAATVLLVRKVLPEHDGGQGPERRRFDVAGAVTFTVAAGAVVAGLIAGSAALIGTGLLALAAFVGVEVRSPQPMLNLRLFRRPAFTGLMLAALVLQGAAFAHLGYTSLWLQTVLGLPPLAAGLVLTPLSLAGLLTSSLAGRRLQGVPARFPVSAGLLLIGTGVLSQALIRPDSGWTVLLGGLIVTGLGAGAMTPPLTSAALASVPAAEAGTASGAVNTFRQLGQAIGVAVLGTAFVRAATTHLHGAAAQPHGVAEKLGGGQGDRVLAEAAPHDRPALADAVHAAFAHGLQAVFLAAGLSALVAGVATWFLLKPREPREGVRGVAAGAARTEPSAADHVPA
ncbi:MFS transporter [Streptomyces sp. ODS28]|uniref:MFS transporter n=1 Tax=Streptomyces sp. ODS28 TaxID=3136688 RepID=UPI0031F01442